MNSSSRLPYVRRPAQPTIDSVGATVAFIALGIANIVLLVNL
jgi:hypothetical protein